MGPWVDLEMFFDPCDNLSRCCIDICHKLYFQLIHLSEAQAGIAAVIIHLTQGLQPFIEITRQIFGNQVNPDIQQTGGLRIGGERSTGASGNQHSGNEESTSNPRNPVFHRGPFFGEFKRG